MAEIKSTLDLVMEKTRHLCLSAKEKEEQTISDFKYKLKGLLQHYEDKTLDMDRFREEYNTLERQFDIKSKKLLQTEILDKLTLDEPSSLLVGLLRDFCRVDTHKLESILSECRAAIQTAAKKRTEQIKDALAKQRRISGDAVIPNLDADSQWLSEVRSLRLKFDRRLDQKKAVLNPLTLNERKQNGKPS